MTRDAIAVVFAALLLVWFPVAAPAAAAGVPQDENSRDEGVPATPALVRQIQFMLLTLGFDPGPIDGNARARTNRAARQFEMQNGLPAGDVVTAGRISSSFLDVLRKQAAGKLGGVAPVPPPVAAEPTVPPPAAPASPPPAEPPADRFANCTFDPEDFLIGAKQYTPQSFLDEGFGGSVDQAVPDLQKRLDEARELAGKIGGAALLEVQRQARVLAYFECRQKIEQASAVHK